MSRFSIYISVLHCRNVNMSEQDNILRELLVKIAKEENYEDSKITIQPIENDGSNYTSSIFTATIRAVGKEDIQLFAKVAVIGEKMRDVTPIQIFKTETYFYKTLLKSYRKLEEEHKVPEYDRIKTPKFYGSNDEYLKEVIVLDNMVAKDFKVADRLKPMSSDYAVQGVRQLAKFHALSQALAVHYPQDYELTKRELEVELGNSLANFLNQMVHTVIEATEESNKQLVTRFIKDVLNRDDLSTFIKTTKTPMLIHGDYRGSNLMYKLCNNDLEIAILDFQTITFGSPVFDLLYFVINGSDKKFFENWFEITLDAYYSELSATLTKFNIEPSTVFSKKDFEDEIQRLLPINLVLGFCTLLVVTVEADKAPKANEELSVKDLAILSPNDIYKERLNGILDYFIDKGLLS